MSSNQKKAIIITGATRGMGKEIALALARTGHPLILAVRDTVRGQEIAQEITDYTNNHDIEVVKLELDKPESVKACANTIKASHDQIYALINNAGTMNRHYEATSSGLENTMAVNTVGTALFSELLQPIIMPGGHVTFTTSLSRNFVKDKSVDINISKKQFSQLGSYSKSKSALTHYALDFAERNPQLYVLCADPGIVNTDIIRMHRWFDFLTDIVFRPFISTPKDGAKAALRTVFLRESAAIVTHNSMKAIKYDIDNAQHTRIIDSIKQAVKQLS